MKTYFYKMVTVSAIIAALSSCERATEAVCPTEIKTAATILTVETARQIYEAEQANQTRSTSENLTPFAVGDPLLHWEQAEPSSSELISSVDIPITGQRQYKVIRYNEKGTAYIVNAHSKIIVVQSNETHEIQTFIRVCIPDAECDSPYSENICNQTLNCDDRGEYTGLEYYATLDGFPAAISRYEAGEMVCGLYFFDETLTREEKVRIFAQLLGNTRIIPIDDTRSLMDDDWDYMHEHYHGELFIGDDGMAYVYVDADRNGVVDSYMLFDDYLIHYYNGSSDGGGSAGGNSGGNNGGNISGNPGSGTIPGGDNSGGSGNNSSGGGSNDGSGDGSDNGPDNSGNNDSGGSVNDLGIEINNPLPFDPKHPYIEGGELVEPPGAGPGGGGSIIPPPKDEEKDKDDPKEDEDDEEKEEAEEDEETRLGREGIQKMISDLESGNVQMYECTITSTGEALLTAAGVGSNTTGIITSCISFLESADAYAVAFGKSLSVAGFVISTAQTYVAFSDGEYSTADWMNAVSTALSGISIVLLPTPFSIVGGALGVTSCLIGLASNFVSYNVPMLIHLEMPDGGDAYLYFA